MALTTAQLEGRKIGGSMAAAACGLNPHRTPRDLWLEVTGRAPAFEGNRATRFGSFVEPWIRSEFTLETGLPVEVEERCLTSERYPWATANIDGWVIEGGDGIRGVFEAKSARYAGDSWGPSGTDEFPLHYLVQVQHYLAVTDAPFAYGCAFIGGGDLRVYRIPRDDKMIARIMDREQRFWHCVETDTEPDCISIADTKSKWPSAEDGSAIDVDGDDDVIAAIRERARLHEEIKRLEDEKDAVEVILRRAIGDTEALMVGGRQVVTLKNQITRRVDTTALREAHPDIVAEFTRETTSRVFRLTKNARGL